MKTLLLSVFALLSSGQAWASGCDWFADGTPYIERIEFKWDREYDAKELWMVCMQMREDICVPQLELSGDSNVYRKELNVGNDTYYGVDLSISTSEWTELSEAYKAKKLTIKKIAENVYGTFDGNCAGPYVPLASGRYHLQLTHTESRKQWDFYFLNRLKYNLQLPLFP